MVTYLFIYTIVAAAPYIQYSDWREVGMFSTTLACHSAAASLGMDAKRFRCITRDYGKVEKP